MDRANDANVTLGRFGSAIDETDTGEPNLTGPARCVRCGHEWEAVVPQSTGFAQIECGNCGGEDTGFGMTLVKRGGAQWRCDCGCFAFGISPAEIYCLNCGMVQTF